MNLFDFLFSKVSCKLRGWKYPPKIFQSTTNSMAWILCGMILEAGQMVRKRPSPHSKAPPKAARSKTANQPAALAFVGVSLRHHVKPQMCLSYLEPQTTSLKRMGGETTIPYVKIWNHPIETTIYIWLFGVPGRSLMYCFIRRGWLLTADRLINLFFEGPQLRWS